LRPTTENVLPIVLPISSRFSGVGAKVFAVPLLVQVAGCARRVRAAARCPQ
jgi:hypothetical protein